MPTDALPGPDPGEGMSVHSATGWLTLQLSSMEEFDENESASPMGLGSLVRAALEGDARGGIMNLLKEIAALTKSFGCVLWRATQGSEPPDKGELTLLAAWFPVQKSHFGVNRADFRTTVAGRTASQAPGWEIDNHLIASGNPNGDKPFFKRNELNRVAACRFEYLPRTGQDPEPGVVMIFRVKSDQPYDTLSVQLLGQIAKIVPFLYSGARQKASYNLLREVGEILRGHPYGPGERVSRQQRGAGPRRCGKWSTRWRRPSTPWRPRCSLRTRITREPSCVPTPPRDHMLWRSGRTPITPPPSAASPRSAF